MPWRITGESIFLYGLCCYWIFINIIFNYDGFNMRNRKAYRKAYYLKGQKHWQEYARNYYHQHKEQVKEYRLKNKQKLRDYDKKYSLENKEKKKAYRLKNRERFRQWQREYYQKNKQAIKIRRYYREELRGGAEARFSRGNGLEAVTMSLPNLIKSEHCNGIRTKHD